MRHSILSLTVSVLTLVALATACNDDTPAGTGPQQDRMYTQVERLGNPLLNEVFIEKRNHGLHNASGPATDVANLKVQVEGFVNQFGRPPAVATTLSAVLLPDELIVDPTKDPATAGWLSWALANGWGGRKLTDDVVDAGTAAIFGDLIAPGTTYPALVGDHVDHNDVAFQAGFPYVAPPHS